MLRSRGFPNNSLGVLLEFADTASEGAADIPKLGWAKHNQGDDNDED